MGVVSYPHVLNCTNSLKNAIIMKTVIIFTLLLLYGGLLAVSKELCSMHRAARDSTRTGNYIVQLHDNVSESSFNRTIERAVSLSQNKRLYMVVRYIEKAFVVNLNYYTALEICHWKEVKSVEEETEVVGAQDINLSWYLDELDQGPNHLKDHQYRPIGTGSGIDAYILDSGINYDHEDFENRAKYPSYDPMDQYYSDQPPRYGSDCQGHGTHVASLLGGKRFGSAKKVTLFSVRVLNCYNAAPWSVVIDGMDHVMKLINKRKRPSIVCMSLGGPTQPAADEAVKRLAELGVIVVVAAGNNKGDACIRSPAGSPHVITVGATNSTYGLYWRYSGTNYGSCVDIFAPGEFIEAAGMDCNNCTRILSGTSMATPLVGGIAAILLQDQPLLTPSDMKQLLVSSSLTDIIDFNSLTPEQSTITPNKFLNIKGQYAYYCIYDIVNDTKVV
jgi:subtilisin family serine protease